MQSAGTKSLLTNIGGINAPTESFFGTFKNEVADTFIDEDDAIAAVFDFQTFYNRERRHSTLNNQSQIQFEQGLKKKAA